MNVYTYHDPILELRDDGLLELWAASWQKHGWQPVVLSKADAERHPLFDSFTCAISALPTVNLPAYEQACYYRWLAMTMTEGGVMSDFDVMNYGFRPEQVRLEDTCTLYESRMPSVVSGTPDAFAKVCEMFCQYRPARHVQELGREHCSDMMIIQANTDQLLLDVQCLEYNDPGWEQARLVHYATSKLSRPKAERIWELRQP